MRVRDGLIVAIFDSREFSGDSFRPKADVRSLTVNDLKNAS
jgi:hypothetical protein